MLSELVRFTNKAVLFGTNRRTGVPLVEEDLRSRLSLREIILQPEVAFVVLRLSPGIVLVIFRVKGVQAMYGNNATSS